MTYNINYHDVWIYELGLHDGEKYKELTGTYPSQLQGTGLPSPGPVNLSQYFYDQTGPIKQKLLDAGVSEDNLIRAFAVWTVAFLEPGRTD